MRDRTNRRKILIGLLAPLMAPLLGGCGDGDRRPPGLRLLQEKRAKLQAGMTVAEVDAVMKGHPRHRSAGEYDSAEGRPLPKLSVFTIGYGDHVGAGEGDYGLTAFFDRDEKLMDTDIGEYSN